MNPIKCFFYSSCICFPFEIMLHFTALAKILVVRVSINVYFDDLNRLSITAVVRVFVGHNIISVYFNIIRLELGRKNYIHWKCNVTSGKSNIISICFNIILLKLWRNNYIYWKCKYISFEKNHPFNGGVPKTKPKSPTSSTHCSFDGIALISVE